MRAWPFFLYQLVWGSVGFCIALWSAAFALDGNLQFWVPFSIAAIVLLKVIHEVRFGLRYFLMGRR